MPYNLSTCLNSVISKTNIISTLHVQNITNYLEISCVLFHKLGTFTPWHKSHHFSSAIVWLSIRPVNFAPGISSSVSHIVSGSFPLVISVLVTIITKFLLINSTHVNKSPHKSPCKQSLSCIFHANLYYPITPAFFTSYLFLK